MKMHEKKLPLVVALASALGLSACGSDTSDENTSAANRTVGVVKAVNSDGSNVSSLNVSGIVFDMSGVSQVNGDEISELSQLGEGMVVSVSGPVNKADDTGVAEDISYDAKIEGIVDSEYNNGQIGVMGQVVVITDMTVFESDVEGITVETIPLGAVVEVSGFMDDQGNIVATRLEVEDDEMDADEELEIEGMVANLNVLNELEGTFMIGDFTIVYDETTLFDDVPDTGLADGMFVEVKLMMNDVGDLVAVKIEAEYDDDMGEGSDDESEIKLVGIVTAEPIDGKFELDGLTIMLGEDVDYEHGDMEDLVVGAYVEVEAYQNADDMLVAKEIEFEEMEEDEVELIGMVTSEGVVDGKFELDGMSIMLSEDVDYENGDMVDIVNGVMLKVEAYYDANDMLVASEIEFVEVGDEFELYGMVTSDGVVDGKFELDGKSIMLGMEVEYEYGDMSNIVNGAKLEVEGYVNEDYMLVAMSIKFEEMASGDEMMNDPMMPEPMM